MKFKNTLLSVADIKESIIAAKKGFEESFSAGDFYNKQTQDERT